LEDLAKQLSFILELDKLKAVARKAIVKPDNNRYENSAEHSWQIALAADVLKEYVDHQINIVNVIKMLLLHDIVEIDAGDTFAFAAVEDLDGQHEKELAAANRIFGMLPESQYQEYLALWLEFEHAESFDAQFAKAVDRILPLVQNVANEGGSWAQHSIKRSQVLARNKYLKGVAPRLWEYAKEQIDLAVTKGWLIAD